MNKKRKVMVGVIFIFIGIGFLLYNFIIQKKQQVFDEMNIMLYEEEVPMSVQQEGEVALMNDNLNDIISNKSKQYYYVGMLEIPKIELKKGFLEIDNKENTVSKNVTVIKGSDYPDVDKGNLILAAHSGTSYLSFFRNLYKLDYNDLAYIYYNNVKYTYQVTNIYSQEKTGEIVIYRNREKNTLTLITCTKDNDNLQTIYILDLIKKEEV